MQIIKDQDGTTLTIAIEGRLDTATAPNFENEIRDSLDGIETLILDFNNLEYVSSAGLRVILTAQKIMNQQGNMKIQNVNEDIMDVFEITGFSDILTIEK